MGTFLALLLLISDVYIIVCLTVYPSSRLALWESQGQSFPPPLLALYQYFVYPEKKTPLGPECTSTANQSRVAETETQ